MAATSSRDAEASTRAATRTTSVDTSRRRAQSMTEMNERRRHGTMETRTRRTSATSGGDGPTATSDVHVLVVDDERICRTVTSSLLRKCGYRVTTAESGEEALELLRRGTEFHLLLTDVMMPGIDGPALLQIVRNDERLRDMPVIMMSANEHSDTVFRCIQYGAEDYLLKPVSRKAVKHMWQHVWRKSQIQSSRAVPRFENGEEILEDEDEDRGELVHGVPAVPEHVPEGMGGEDANAAAKSPSPTPSPTLPRNNSTLSFAATGASVKADVAAYPFAAPTAAQQMDNVSQGSVVKMVIDAADAGKGDEARSRVVPESIVRPLPAPLSGLENGSRRLREWLDDESAGAQATQKEERWHVAGQILAFVDAVNGCGYASYELFDANCLDISPQGAISFAARSQVAADQDEYTFVELAQELGDQDPLFVVGLVILNMFWPDVFVTMYEADYPAKALEKVITMSGFAKRAMTAELAAAKVVVSLLRQKDRATARDASERLRTVAGDARAHGVETERRLETLKRLETVLETLRTARDSQLRELTQSHGMLDVLLAEAGVAKGSASEHSDSPDRKRARVVEHAMECYDDETLTLKDLDSVVHTAFKSPKSLEPAVFADLERGLFDKCAVAIKEGGTKGDSDAAWLKRVRADGVDTTAVRDALEEFENEICLATRAVSIKRCASIGGDFADFAANNSMVCCASWDRDGELFATAGTSKSICVYETSAVMTLGARVHCPAVEFEAHSKVSALCYNPYVKQSIASGDYQGVVQLWDVQKETSTWENTTHRRRVWSIDFSHIDPTKLASASDDGTVRIFSTTTKEGVCTLQNRANVCSVKFHPTSAHMLAIGSADHRIHVYDLRQPSTPLMTLQGHRKAVSYVHWVGDELVSASTDNTLKLWDIKRNDPRTACVRTYVGHTNEKNFVGLSANADGYIACGSEDNIVHVYAKHASSPVAHYGFADKPTPMSHNRRDKGGFISSVVWSPNSKHLLAANSRGHLKILSLNKAS